MRGVEDLKRLVLALELIDVAFPSAHEPLYDLAMLLETEIIRARKETPENGIVELHQRLLGGVHDRHADAAMRARGATCLHPKTETTEAWGGDLFVEWCPSCGGYREYYGRDKATTPWRYKAAA